MVQKKILYQQSYYVRICTEITNAYCQPLLSTHRPPLFEAPPKVDVPAKEVLSYTGKEAIEIACKVSGLPKADISWHKVNGRIPASAVVKSNGNLVLKNLSTADAGFYKCIGKNDLGTSDAVAEVRVQGNCEFSQ